MKPTSEQKHSVSFLLKKNYRSTWWLVFLFSLSPSLILLYQFLTNQLGINPLETLIHTTGKWALIFLIITLLVTPLRRFMSWSSRKIHLSYGKRLSDWNWIIRLRRMLGLYCFYYATLHLFIFLNYDLGWEWEFLWEEIEEKNYLLLGFIAFFLISLLAVTSFNQVIRWMGKYWKILHRFIYLIAIIVIVHFWMLVKVGIYSPAPYTLLIFLLLGYRMLSYYGVFFKKPTDKGGIVKER